MAEPLAAVNATHGTRRTYATGCRCNPCVAASATDRAARRKAAYLHGPRLVDALGTARRLQALGALGWTVTALADHSGLGRRTLTAIMYGEQAATRRELAAVVDATYRQLGDTRPATWQAARARLLAARRGWAPPAAWDDIDDPGETPTGHEAPDPAKRTRDDVAIEHAHLRSYGYSDAQIADRLGMRVNSLQVALRRAAA